jgi:putative hemolysin
MEKRKEKYEKNSSNPFFIKTSLKENKCIIIFPSGRLAKFTCRGLIDRKWESSAAMLARKYQTQVVPLKIEARNSFLYYLFAWISRELRDITLFNELLNKKGKTFKLTFGEPITSENLSKNAVEATQKIRGAVESL